MKKKQINNIKKKGEKNEKFEIRKNYYVPEFTFRNITGWGDSKQTHQRTKSKETGRVNSL